jgi:hypothetical protein
VFRISFFLDPRDANANLYRNCASEATRIPAFFLVARKFVRGLLKELEGQTETQLNLPRWPGGVRSGKRARNYSER